MCLTLLEWILSGVIVVVALLWLYTLKVAEDWSVSCYERGYEDGRNSEKRDRFNLGQTVEAMRAAQSFDVIMQDEDLDGARANRVRESFEKAIGEKRDDE